MITGALNLEQPQPMLDMIKRSSEKQVPCEFELIHQECKKMADPQIDNGRYTIQKSLEVAFPHCRKASSAKLDIPQQHSRNKEDLSRQIVGSKKMKKDN